MSEPRKKFVSDEQTKNAAGKIMDGLESECNYDKSEEECSDDEELNKVPCKYCGALIDPTSDVSKCPSCGTPL